MSEYLLLEDLNCQINSFISLILLLLSHKSLLRMISDGKKIPRTHDVLSTHS